jgi:hypothetical protein
LKDKIEKKIIINNKIKITIKKIRDKIKIKNKLKGKNMFSL